MHPAFQFPIPLRPSLRPPQCLHSRRINYAVKRPTSRHCTTSCTDVGESPSATTSFTWAVGESNEYKLVDAVREAVTRASATLSRRNVTTSVAFLFVKSRAENTTDDQMRRAVPTARKALAMRRVLASETIFFGCSSNNYSNPDDEPTVIVALVHFPPGTSIQTFCINETSMFDIDWKQKQWHEFVGLAPPFQKDPFDDTEPESLPQSSQIFLLQHPNFDQMAELLSGLDFAYPGVPKLGAQAGAVNPLHEIYLFDTNGHVSDGVIGIAISSADVQMDVSVAQGARGVGPIMEVTEVRDGNEIARVREVDTATKTNAPPMILLDMWASNEVISEQDRAHSRQYLLFGVEIDSVAQVAQLSLMSSLEADAKKTEPDVQQPPDMVIRKVIGFNEATKSLTIEGSDVRLGSRVQFQIRDEEAARAELVSLFEKLQLEGSSRAMDGMAMMGSLLLVDSERGAYLYGKVNADLDRTLYSERFPVPIAVLSSQGQIGPLPSGGLLGAAGNAFMLSASALYVSFYGRV